MGGAGKKEEMPGKRNGAGPRGEAAIYPNLTGQLVAVSVFLHISRIYKEALRLTDPWGRKIRSGPFWGVDIFFLFFFQRDKEKPYKKRGP
jgi:hypothetical protein